MAETLWMLSLCSVSFCSRGLWLHLHCRLPLWRNLKLCFGYPALGSRILQGENVFTLPLLQALVAMEKHMPSDSRLWVNSEVWGCQCACDELFCFLATTTDVFSYGWRVQFWCQLHSTIKCWRVTQWNAEVCWVACVNMESSSHLKKDKNNVTTVSVRSHCWLCVACS